jgi:hypothetical protein
MEGQKSWKGPWSEVRQNRIFLLHVSFYLCLLWFGHLEGIQGNVLSLKDGSAVTGWMESGTAQLKTNIWTTVTTTTSFTNPIVFLR